MENETYICCLFTTLCKSSLYTNPPPGPTLKLFKGYLAQSPQRLYMYRIKRKDTCVPARAAELLNLD